jgi:hypothetical protein
VEKDKIKRGEGFAYRQNSMGMAASTVLMNYVSSCVFRSVVFETWSYCIKEKKGETEVRKFLPSVV